MSYEELIERIIGDTQPRAAPFHGLRECVRDSAARTLPAAAYREIFEPRWPFQATLAQRLDAYPRFEDFEAVANLTMVSRARNPRQHCNSPQPAPNRKLTGMLSAPEERRD